MRRCHGNIQCTTWDRSVVNTPLGLWLRFAACLCVCSACVIVRLDSLPVVIRMCIVACSYLVRKPKNRVHTSKRVNESPVKSDSNGDYRWSKVVRSVLGRAGDSWQPIDNAVHYVMLCTALCMWCHCPM